jgi:predicted nuclease of predicted toxin-antitoxin system
MKVRFQADADLNQVILLATMRREPAVDFQTPTAAGLQGLTDLEVLTRAASDNRVLVTHDRKTMPKYFGEFVMTKSSPIPQSLSVTAAVANAESMGFYIDQTQSDPNIR